jgi:DNA-binding response OmpR family regulator
MIGGDTEWVRVLVVEDNEAMADAVSRGLIAEGFDVDIAPDGQDGLWRAREFSYDVIVLDIMLPGLNGYEVCRTIRAEGIATPVLMLTAKDGEYDIAEGLEFGADDYLTKPFSFVVLVARIRALLRRTNPVPGTEVIANGSLTIDTARRRCRVGEQVVELTPREYTLLETLARRVGQPLTRDELLDHVWGADHSGGSNVVDVYVGYLRKKLNAADAGVPAIETVRGVGYRLAES